MKRATLFSLIVCFLFLVVFTFHSTAQDKKVISLLDLTGSADANVVTDFVSDALYEIVGSDYRIIDRSMRDSILREQEFSLSGLCDEIACALEVGRLLAADYLVLGRFTILEEERHLVLRLVNVNTSEIEGISTTKTLYLADVVHIAKDGVSELFGVQSASRNSEQIVSDILKLKPSTFLLDNFSMREKLLLRDRTDSYPWWLVAGITSSATAGLGMLMGVYSIVWPDTPTAVIGVLLLGGSVTLSILSFSRFSRLAEWFRIVDDQIPSHLK